MDKFQVGYQMITWVLGPEGLEQGLKDVAALGARYVETLNESTLSDDFARRYLQFGAKAAPRVVSDMDYFSWLNLLIDAKQTYGIQPTSVYCNAEFTNPHTAHLEIAQFRGTAAILQSLGARHLVCGGGPPCDGDHTADDYAAMAKALHEMGRCCQAFGIQLCYHPHLDTFVEDGQQLRRFVEATDGELVALCIDPAHLAMKGCDAVDIFETYIERIKYCHLKDVKGTDPQSLRGAARWDAFAELGEGRIDFPGILAVLRRHAYAGPVIIELDRTTRGARASAEMSKRYLTEVLGLEL